jgi:nucleoside 2-deoxyribosyltransferase
MKIYLAGPLFSESERDWHRTVKYALIELGMQLEHKIQVIWPYELITAEEIPLLGARAQAEIFNRCRGELDTTDMLVALLDGAQVDDGTAWEIGYFFAMKSPRAPIIGVRTDFRQAGEAKGSIVNAMVEVACDVIVKSRIELLQAVTDLIHSTAKK